MELAAARLMFDVILCLELAVLAAVLLMRHPPIHAFPTIFPKPSSAGFNVPIP
jgi:hypothetical protein